MARDALFWLILCALAPAPAAFAGDGRPAPSDAAPQQTGFELANLLLLGELPGMATAAQILPAVPRSGASESSAPDPTGGEVVVVDVHWRSPSATRPADGGAPRREPGATVLRGGRERVSATSLPIDLHELRYAKLELRLNGRGLEADSELELLFAIGDGPWRGWHTIAAPATLPTLAIVALPPESLQDEVRIRVNVSALDVGDAWEISGARIVAARYALTLLATPAATVPLQIRPRDTAGVDDGLTPTARYYGSPTSLTVVAPQRTARHVFDRWIVDGRPQTDGELAVAPNIAGDTVLLAEYQRLGDMNDDGVLDQFDVDAFVQALVDAELFSAQYSGVDRVSRGDMNGDGVLDDLDIESFVDLLFEP
jgi:hypothetical protein